MEFFDIHMTGNIIESEEHSHDWETSLKEGMKRCLQGQEATCLMIEEGSSWACISNAIIPSNMSALSDSLVGYTCLASASIIP